MANRELRIDTVGVGTAGATAAAAVSRVGLVAPQVTPCAADATSVSVAYRVAERIAALGLATAGADRTTEAAAARLHTDADAYDAQDASSATWLSTIAGTSNTVAHAPNIPALLLPLASESPSAPTGLVPATGHEIAQVVHSGPGPLPVLALASELEGGADDLERSATSVNTARKLTADSWTSDAADAADEHLATLQKNYRDQAANARALARELRGHAADFARAKAEIPPPQHFADLEARLQAAAAANAHPASMGRFTQQIADLQLALAAATNDAVHGYSRYQQATQNGAGTMNPEPDRSNGSGPGSRPDGAGGAEDNENHGRDTQTLDGAKPSPSDAPTGADGVGDVPAQLMSTILPAVLGGVTGAAGGLLGALSSAGQRVQQVGSQLATGIAQGAGAMNPHPPDASSGGPSGRAHPPEPQLDDLGGGGGPQPGDFEPAGGVGPAGALAAPASAAAVPAASPALYSLATPSSAATESISGGAAMMPPMMPMTPHAGGVGGEDDRRLYRERRVRIEAPPNSEPVKGRREPRRARGEQGSGTNR